MVPGQRCNESNCVTCDSSGVLTRRRLLGVSAGAVGSLLLAGKRNLILAALFEQMAQITPFKPCGPGASYIPRVMAAGYYQPRDPKTGRPPEGQGYRHVGRTYDPKANYEGYLKQLREAAKTLNIQLDIAPAPFFTAADARPWRAEVEKKKPDGLVVMRLDFTAGPMMEVETTLLGLDVPMLFFVPNQRMFGWGAYGLHERHTRPGRLLCGQAGDEHRNGHRRGHVGPQARRLLHADGPVEAGGQLRRAQASRRRRPSSPVAVRPLEERTAGLLSSIQDQSEGGRVREQNRLASGKRQRGRFPRARRWVHANPARIRRGRALGCLFRLGHVCRPRSGHDRRC